MRLYYQPVEIETLKWLKTNPFAAKSLEELHEMVKDDYSGTVEQLGIQYSMMEKEGLLLNGNHQTPCEITKEGLIALRSHNY